MPQLDLGKVVGPQGPQGPEGPAGPQGIQGPAGDPATINGVTTLTVAAGDNVNLEQSGSTVTLSVPTGTSGGVAGLGENGAVPVAQGGTGAIDTQAALANLGASPNPNLLDNAYFVGGGSQQGGGQLPINQQGQTSYTGSNVSAIDRWRIYTNTCGSYLLDQGVKIQVNQANSIDTRTMYQMLQNPSGLIGQTITASYLVQDVSGEGFIAGIRFSISGEIHSIYASVLSPGLYKASIEIPSGTTEIISSVVAKTNAQTNDYIVLSAAKLERGPFQTLGYQDSTGAWKLLPQTDMDYTTQLTTCQRYQVPIASGISVRASLVTTNYITFLVPVPCTLRTTPSISGSGLVVRNVGGGIESGFTFSADYSGPGWVRIRATKTNHGLSDAELTTTAQVMLVSNL